MKERNKKGTSQNVRKARNKQMDLIEELKMEIATELGIMEQINNFGWHSLSPRESGKIGGKLSQRLKKLGH
ncbi:MAG TPA: small, acid-soluble spore protein, alpha/beta type [Peptococcaceae bacterium]|nr:small, acid-soluble spore protein, alpha/beta type [Peptococcaceae bacterium]